MDKIDAHHHFWNYNAVDYPWIDDSMLALRRTFACEDLILATRDCGITGAVTVQARTCVDETESLLMQAHACDLVKGVVGWAPLKDENVGDVLDRWFGDPCFKGIREICQGAQDSEFFENPEFDRGIRALTERSLPFDLLLFENQLDAVIRFVDRHPNQAFIVDHIAKPVIKGAEFSEQWSKRLKELGRRDHVVGCKFSGVVTEVRDAEWSVNTLMPYFSAALEAFGSHRLMFGSDWPVCVSRVSYLSWVKVVDALTKVLSPEDQRQFYADNVVRAYGLA